MPLICLQCNQNFTSAEELNSHIASHYKGGRNKSLQSASDVATDGDRRASVESTGQLREEVNRKWARAVPLSKQFDFAHKTKIRFEAMKFLLTLKFLRKKIRFEAMKFYSHLNAWKKNIPNILGPHVIPFSKPWKNAKTLSMSQTSDVDPH